MSALLRRLPAMLMLACLFLACHARAAERVDELAKMLPSSSGVVLCLKNTSKVLKGWDASAFSRFLRDPAAKKWLAPMYGEDGLMGFDKYFKDEGGATFREQLAVYPGAVAVGFDFSEMEDGGDARAVALSDIKGRERQLTASKATELEAKKKKKYPNAVMKTAEVDGTKVSVIAESDADDAKWLDVWTVLDGIAIETSDEASMQAAIDSVKSGGEGAKTVEQLAHVAELNGGASDVTILVNLEILVDMLKKKISEENTDSAAAVFNPAALIDALGLDELKAAALTMDLSGARGTASFVLLHSEKPKGLVPALLRGSGTEVPQPAFLPASADQVNVSRQSFGDMYDALLSTVQKLGPLAVMLTAQIEQMEKKAGINLRQDLLGSLDNVVAQAQTMKVAANGMPEISQVTAIKLKDRARFQSALDAALALMGNGFVVFEDSEIEGQNVRALKLTGAQPDPNQPNSRQIAFTVTDEYFIFCQGTQDMLQKVLARIKSKATDGSVWELPSTQAALAALPPDFTGMSVSNGASLARTFAEMFTRLQNLAPNSAAAPRAAAGPKTRPGAKNPGSSLAQGGLLFDPKALPDKEVFARYFGVTATGNYSGADSTMIKIIALPVGK